MRPVARGASAARLGAETGVSDAGAIGKRIWKAAPPSRACCTQIVPRKSSTTRAAHAIDKSPEPSTYADGGCGYNLSRFAMASILIAATSDRGQRLIRNSFMEDKLVGDLLSRRSPRLPLQFLDPDRYA